MTSQSISFPIARAMLAITSTDHASIHMHHNPLDITASLHTQAESSGNNSKTNSCIESTQTISSNSHTKSLKPKQKIKISTINGILKLNKQTSKCSYLFYKAGLHAQKEEEIKATYLPP